MKNIFRGGVLVGFLLSFPIVSAAPLNQTLTNVWNQILYVAGLSYLGVTSNSLDAFTRLLIWILIFAILFAGSAFIGTKGNALFTKNQRLIITGVIATISTIFLPVQVLLAAGAGFGTVVGLVLVGLPLIGLVFLLNALGDECHWYWIRILIVLLFMWIATAMQYHLTSFAGTAALSPVYTAVDEFIGWQITVAAILLGYYIIQLINCGDESEGLDPRVISDLVDRFRQDRRRNPDPPGPLPPVPPPPSPTPPGPTPPGPTPPGPTPPGPTPPGPTPPGPTPPGPTPPGPTPPGPTPPGPTPPGPIPGPDDEKLKKILEAIAALALRFEGLEGKFTSTIGPLATKLNEIDAKADRIDSRVEGVDTKVEKIGADVLLNAQELRDVKSMITSLGKENRKYMKRYFKRNFKLLIKRVKAAEEEIKEVEKRIKEHLTRENATQTATLLAELQAESRRIDEMKRYIIDNFAKTESTLQRLEVVLAVIKSDVAHGKATTEILRERLESLMALVRELKTDEERVIVVNPPAIHIFEKLEKIIVDLSNEVKVKVENGVVPPGPGPTPPPVPPGKKKFSIELKMDEKKIKSPKGKVKATVTMKGGEKPYSVIFFHTEISKRLKRQKKASKKHFDYKEAVITGNSSTRTITISGENGDVAEIHVLAETADKQLREAIQEVHIN
jgi:hypothetical protein